jgi:hypothetical protein
MLMMAAVAATAGGCTSYYRVHDPTTGKDYYTTELKEKNGGATQLKDARTGGMVTVQNSEVHQINKEEFESGKNTAPAQPAPKASTPFQ